MSNIQYAFIECARLPQRDALQAAVDALGFDLQLAPGDTGLPPSGFLPCVLNGVTGPGFEIRHEPAADVIGDDRAMRQMAAGRDHCISMAWHGSMQDLVCVLIVSAALVKDFDAVVSYEGEPPEPLSSLLSTAREVLHDEQAKAAQLSGPVPAPTHAAALARPARPWWRFW